MEAPMGSQNNEHPQPRSMPRTWRQAIGDPMFNAIANPPRRDFEVLEQVSDPGKFIIPCTIWGMEIEGAMADTGAGINVITSCLTETFPKVMIEPYDTRVTLVDSSTRESKRIARSFPIFVNGVMVPTDLVIIDSTEDGRRTPRVVLGRPFLATVGAILNFHTRRMVFKNLYNIAIPMEFKEHDDLMNMFCGMMGRGKMREESKGSNDEESGIYPTNTPTQDDEEDLAKDLANGIKHLEMNPRHLIESAILFHDESGVEASREDFIALSRELETSLSTRPRASKSFHNLLKSLKAMIKASSRSSDFKFPNLHGYLSGFLDGASGSDGSKYDECFLLGDDDEPPRELSELEKITGYWHAIQANTPAWEERFFLSTSDYVSKEAHEDEVAKLYYPPSKKGKEKIPAHTNEDKHREIMEMPHDYVWYSSPFGRRIEESNEHVEVPNEEELSHIEMPTGLGWYSSPTERRIEESIESSAKGKQPLLPSTSKN